MSEPIEPVYRTLGKRICHERQRRGLTQQQLADTLRITRASLANIESGRQRLQVHTLTTLAAQLGLEVAELFQASSSDPQGDALLQAVEVRKAEVKAARAALAEAMAQLDRAKKDFADYAKGRRPNA